MSKSDSMRRFEVRQMDRPPCWLRLLLVTVGLGLTGIFVIAAMLNPDARGYGTHQQLGLPPCYFQSATGLLCPHCGMTTSFSNLVRGHFAAAWQANPMGPLLAVLLTVAAPWCLATGFLGKWIITPRPFHWFVVTAILYLSVAAVTWVLRILL